MINLENGNLSTETSTTNYYYENLNVLNFQLIFGERTEGLMYCQYSRVPLLNRNLLCLLINLYRLFASFVYSQATLSLKLLHKQTTAFKLCTRCSLYVGGHISQLQSN